MRRSRCARRRVSNGYTIHCWYCFAATTGLIVANMFLYMMTGEINQTRAEGNLVLYFGFAFPKMQRIFSEYRARYPNGRLHIYALVALAAAMVGLLGAVRALGFFG